MLAIVASNSIARRLVDLIHRAMIHRIVDEPVWAYLLWLTICGVAAVAIIWGILSGAASCPAGTPGC